MRRIWDRNRIKVLFFFLCDLPLLKLEIGFISFIIKSGVLQLAVATKNSEIAEVKHFKLYDAVVQVQDDLATFSPEVLVDE